MTPPTSPAAAVATPVTSATFDDPFELFDRAAEDPLPDAPLCEALLREEPLREDAPALLPREDALPLLLRDALLFGLDPFELLLFEVFRCVPEREVLWAICSSLSRMPRNSAYPN
jgi:hypothetical protein